MVFAFKVIAKELGERTQRISELELKSLEEKEKYRALVKQMERFRIAASDSSSATQAAAFGEHGFGSTLWHNGTK
jgi:hypothetical protein